MANNIDELSVLTSESKETIRRLLDIENGDGDSGGGEGGGEGSTTSLQNIVDAENGGVIEGLTEENLPDELKGADQSNQATGKFAHAEGGYYSYDEDEGSYYAVFTTASGDSSHAEGAMTQATGTASHAEGRGTIAGGVISHAEGFATHANGNSSHAEGSSTTASGEFSHAEGQNTKAIGANSHAEGGGTIANHADQHVFGRFNTPDDSLNNSSASGNFVEIVGNGSSDDNRSNARTLDWNGNERLAGTLTIADGTADEVTITGAQLKALLALLN